MIVRFALPLALVSVIALAACDNRTPAPAEPNPDAGNPESFAEPVEDEPVDTDELMSPQEMQQRREEIEQDAQQTFESIMEETNRAGDDLVEMGNEALDTLTNQMSSASSAIAVQIDALVDNAAELRDENLTDEQKLEIVANVRNAAEEAARALGQDSAGVIQAGNTAEARTREVLGLP
ncbi:hypothetical protein [Pelagibacterium lacus]|uniref:Uncharacterized protein n=1 Tax=Pelagibacterium lacus TaxID=2282655 RepID=A0A369W7B1_9HYPH|nr:hypothetical protein [Pelagibacterium lacus]RDE10223.1 hypothetical protein DVH29_02175 [Pelagibacterium lacus]